MRSLSIILFCGALLFISACSRKKNFTEANFEATIEKAHKEKDPELILSYLNNTASIPAIYKATAYNQVALIYSKMENQTTKAIDFFNKAILTAGPGTTHESALIKRVALLKMAIIYVNENDLIQAKSLYLKLLEEYKNYPLLKMNHVKFYIDIALICLNEKKYHEEKKYLQKALTLQAKLNQNSIEMVKIYSFLVDCHINLNEYDLAEKSGQNAILICNKINKQNSLYAGILYFLTGKTYFHKNMRKAALEYMQKAYLIFMKERGATHNNTKEAAKLLKEWRH